MSDCLRHDVGDAKWILTDYTLCNDKGHESATRTHPVGSKTAKNGSREVEEIHECRPGNE